MFHPVWSHYKLQHFITLLCKRCADYKNNLHYTLLDLCWWPNSNKLHLSETKKSPLRITYHEQALKGPAKAPPSGLNLEICEVCKAQISSFKLDIKTKTIFCNISQSGHIFTRNVQPCWKKFLKIQKCVHKQSNKLDRAYFWLDTVCWPAITSSPV